jgi:signal transduction histidine kinase
MRIRKKMIVLHTLFSLAMTLILLVTLRPALVRVVARAEQQEASRMLELVLAAPPDAIALEGELTIDRGQVRIRRGVDPRTVPTAWVDAARQTPGIPHIAPGRSMPGIAAAWTDLGGVGELWIAESSIESSRKAVLGVYALAVLALLIVYTLVAGALELFVLPQQVYSPIARILDADLALSDGRPDQELVAEESIPSDELGEIMRSRNETIRRIRRHEHALAEALDQIELVASDLKRKNHLLENAQRNLADADRLVSLGIMAAGIAHELNTPHAVAKGLVEKLDAAQDRALSPTETALLRRVVGRIERLGESLLDFARVRPPETAPVPLRSIVSDAVELVRLDRNATRSTIDNRVHPDLIIEADADRLVQVLVNLIRNSLDALADQPRDGLVEVEAESVLRSGDRWISLTVTDNGPGIDPEILLHMFEPFVTSRLDDRGTGLGLAVSEGIVREHGGTLLARNRPGRSGAQFEVMLPAVPAASPSPDLERP